MRQMVFEPSIFMCVGNVFKKIDLLEFTKLIRNEWTKTRYGANDIDIKPPSRVFWNTSRRK